MKREFLSEIIEVHQLFSVPFSVKNRAEPISELFVRVVRHSRYPIQLSSSRNRAFKISSSRSQYFAA